MAASWLCLSEWPFRTQQLDTPLLSDATTWHDTHTPLLFPSVTSLITFALSLFLSLFVSLSCLARRQKAAKSRRAQNQTLVGTVVKLHTDFYTLFPWWEHIALFVPNVLLFLMTYMVRGSYTSPNSITRFHTVVLLDPLCLYGKKKWTYWFSYMDDAPGYRVFFVISSGCSSMQRLFQEGAVAKHES